MITAFSAKPERRIMKKTEPDSSKEHGKGNCKKTQRVDTKAKQFVMGTVKQWSTTLREAVRFPSLGAFKTGLNKALINLGSH